MLDNAACLLWNVLTDEWNNVRICAAKKLKVKQGVEIQTDPKNLTSEFMQQRNQNKET